MASKIFPFICALTLVSGAYAAINTINNNNGAQWDWQQDEAYQEAQDIATLENDIRLLDEEIAKCEKKKKGWTAATIVGGVGVVATGVGAIVQANQLSDKKDTYKEKKEELDDAKTRLGSYN